METRESRLAAKYADQPKLMAYLIEHPRARRTRPTALILSTSCRRVYSCICGERESESAKWRRTKRVASWIRLHDAQCGK